MHDATNISPLTSTAGKAGLAVVIGLALLKLGLHLATATQYGLFIDELYFLASGEHLAWGYVDMPPLTAFTAWLARTLFNDSILGIRLIPAIAGAGLVLLTGAIVHELGGKGFAQAIAGLGVVIGLVYLVTNSYLSMNAIEPLIWMGCAYTLIRLVKTDDRRLWLIFGILAGVGLLNKHTMLVFGFALLSGLLLTPARKFLWSRWFFLGGGIAFVIFLPNLIWMILHHFPHLEQLANIRQNQRNVSLSVLEYLGQQVYYQHPLTLPVWLGGLGFFFFHPRGKAYRFLGWAYLLALGVLLATNGRPYYLSPIYPMLLAGGAVGFEGWLAARRWAWLKPLSLAVMGIGGLVAAPLALPVLPPDIYLRYAAALRVTQPRIENHRLGALPQLFADRFGWPEMAEATARVYNKLTPEEQSTAVIFAENYGQAGAIDFYGPALGLPKALSGHLTYFYWGEEIARQISQDATVIALGMSGAKLQAIFSQVKVAGYVSHPYAMPYENFPIYLCRGLKVPLEELWPSVKNWN